MSRRGGDDKQEEYHILSGSSPRNEGPKPHNGLPTQEFYTDEEPLESGFEHQKGLTLGEVEGYRKEDDSALKRHAQNLMFSVSQATGPALGQRSSQQPFLGTHPMVMTKASASNILEWLL